MNTGDSLRGQNEHRRMASAGSSPAPSTRSQRTRLWRRLRKLDSKISQLDYGLWIQRHIGSQTVVEKMECQRIKADASRLSVRNKLKGYE